MSSPKPKSPFVCFTSLAGALLCLGCAGSDPADEGPSEPIASAASPEILGFECHQHEAGGGWSNGFIPQQSARFWARFILEPSQTPMDGVIGLSDGPADAFTDLAAIVRLNPSGLIDVRNGSAYMADTPFMYEPDKRVRVDMSVDIPNRVYDVYVDPSFEWDPDAPSIPLARGYRFRTEQAGASRLDNVGRIVDSASGSFELCAFGASANSEDRCLTPVPSGGWSSKSFPSQSGRFRATFEMYVGDHAPIDWVLGFSNGEPAGFRSLAAILRFNPDGLLDVRDAGAYRYDVAVPYSAWQIFRARMEIDVPSRLYSVTVTKYEYWQEPKTYALATNYRFRSEQAFVTALSHFGSIVDSAAGNPNACDLLIDY